MFFNPIPNETKRPSIVLDIQNIALKHGDNKIFSCKGVQIAVNYFQILGFKVISFAPEYILDSEKVLQTKRAEVGS